MYSLDHERILFSCPVCHQDFKALVEELYSRKRISCQRVRLHFGDSDGLCTQNEVGIVRVRQG